MADGDPMVLQTIYGDPEQSLVMDGPLEIFPPLSADPTYWHANAAFALVKSSGTRSGGSGSYYWSLTRAATASQQVGGPTQNNTTESAIWVAGNDALPARGHLGMTFYASMWVKEDGSDVPSIVFGATEVDSAANLGTTHTLPSWYPVTTGWTRAVAGPFYVTDSDFAGFVFSTTILSTVTGTTSIHFDDIQLYFSYTFTANPSMPDQQAIFNPTRKFGRTIGGDLYVASGDLTAAKHQKVLNFGLIGLDQFKALRSLWLLGRPMRWTPNHPHMPASLDVMMTNADFSMSLGRGGFGSNIYRGSIELSEI